MLQASCPSLSSLPPANVSLLRGSLSELHSSRAQLHIAPPTPLPGQSKSTLPRKARLNKPWFPSPLARCCSARCCCCCGCQGNSVAALCCTSAAQKSARHCYCAHAKHAIPSLKKQVLKKQGRGNRACQHAGAARHKAGQQRASLKPMLRDTNHVNDPGW